MKIRIMLLTVSVLCAVVLSGCSSKKSPSASDPATPVTPLITTIGGPDNESWTEAVLTASDLPPVQIHLGNSPRSWIYANVLRSSEAFILNENQLSGDEAEAMADNLVMRPDGWPAGLPDGCYMWLNTSSYPTGVEIVEGTERKTYLHGVWVLTWEGSGTVQFRTSINDGTGEKLLLDDSANGRIVKQITTPYKYPAIFIRSSDAADPVRNVKLWAPLTDGAGLSLTETSELSRGNVAGSLEPLPGAEEPLFHPVFLDHIKQAGPGIPLRMMSFLKINQDPEKWDRELTWDDRANPLYAFGSLSVCDSRWTRYNVAGYKQKLGVPYEWLIELCNETDNDLWLQVPHMASEDLVRNLARLVAGKNGHPGLKSSLRVWFEYSNELWNGAGVYLPQHDRSVAVAAEHFGVSESEVTTQQRGWGAGRLQGWALAVFENEWANCGGSDGRLINVVAGFALSPSFNRAQLNAVKEINPDLAETLAISNYFGHPATREIFASYDWAASDGQTWPESLLQTTRSALRKNLYSTYDAWCENYRLAQDEAVRLISYEGGQHITPVGLGDSSDPDFKKFMNYLSYIERNDLMKELYTEHYALWSTAGGRTVSLFIDIGGHSYWGYWGAKEWITESRTEAKKWDAFLTWTDTMQGVRALNEPLTSAPVLEGGTIKAEAGIPFTQTINAQGGDGTVVLSMIGGELPEGVSFNGSGNGTAVISGTPVTSCTARIVVRALDSDNDPAYCVYTLFVDPEGMSDHSILAFNGADIPATVQTNGDTNGRYDPQRAYEYWGTDGAVYGIPFMFENGTVLFGDEFNYGLNSIPALSPLTMYGGWCVTQLPGSGVPNCQTSYTGLRENKFISWSGANYNGTGAATNCSFFLVWKKEQFTGNTASAVYSFGPGHVSATLRVDITDLISDGDNELRFAVLNREGGMDTWYVSEAAYTEQYIGDGYFELSDFNGSATEGKRWAVIQPSAYSFAIPSISSLTFEAKSFTDIQAVGLLYHGSRRGYHYNVGFNRFLVLGELN